MQSMQCWNCLLKHLAAALSYGKEVLAGHGRGNELDHRPDLLGEIVNAEHHAKLLDQSFFRLLNEYRQNLQTNQAIPGINDIEYLRGLYGKAEELSSKPLLMATIDPAYRPIPPKERNCRCRQRPETADELK
ncbi:hypothetical protein [Victivallis sp. Marseille-Q1083]|uniref:hypothetical protein n=1 Tax=Victivallis sp. Marseille-Q1083 TaxID=2717288 RepID=UPI00158C394C|nr:hypothetical protein [Victivallis sp. Marseille-Q1083]